MCDLLVAAEIMILAVWTSAVVVMAVSCYYHRGAELMRLFNLTTSYTICSGAVINAFFLVSLLTTDAMKCETRSFLPLLVGLVLASLATFVSLLFDIRTKAFYESPPPTPPTVPLQGIA